MGDDYFSETDEDEDDEFGMIPEVYVEMIEKVEEFGWSSMTWGEDEYTVLHWAAKHNMADLCSRLIAKGADPRHRDAQGFDALDYAREENSQAALRMMESGEHLNMDRPVFMLAVSHKPRCSVAVQNRRLSKRVSTFVRAQ